MNKQNKRTIGIIFGIVAVFLLVVFPGISFFHQLAGGDDLPIAITGATSDLTHKYADVDFGITPTVKRYKNAVFDIEKIRETIEQNGSIEVTMGGVERKIDLERSDCEFSGTTPEFVSYVGTGEGKFYEHLSISNTSVILWIRADGTDYFTDTTTREEEDGRLVHYLYTSKDTGWSAEHKGNSGYTLSPFYLGDEISDTERKIYHFSEEDFLRFPTVGRFLKYGAGNLELTDKEAEDIHNLPGTVLYNGHYYDLLTMVA